MVEVQNDGMVRVAWNLELEASSEVYWNMVFGECRGDVFSRQDGQITIKRGRETTT